MAGGKSGFVAAAGTGSGGASVIVKRVESHRNSPRRFFGGMIVLHAAQSTKVALVIEDSG